MVAAILLRIHIGRKIQLLSDDSFHLMMEAIHLSSLDVLTYVRQWERMYNTEAYQFTTDSIDNGFLAPLYLLRVAAILQKMVSHLCFIV
jgi:hypothetical protein